MSWSRRSVLAGLSALPLSACGFQPVFAPGGSGDALRQRVAFADPQNLFEFDLVRQLETRLGRTSLPVYALTYEIAIQRDGIAITESNDTTRVRLTGTARYTLTERAGDTQVLAGEVTSFTAYSTTGSTLASDSAARDAEARLMLLLADLMSDALISGAARFT